MEGPSASLAIREMQINPTTGYHFTLVRMTIINKSTVIGLINTARLWSKGNPSTFLVGMQTGEATVENSMEIL